MYYNYCEITKYVLTLCIFACVCVCLCEGEFCCIRLATEGMSDYYPWLSAARAVGVQKHAKHTHKRIPLYIHLYWYIHMCVCVCILNTVTSRVSGNASEDLYTLASLLANALCCFIDVCVYICAYANMYVCVCVCIYSSCNPFCCFCRHTPTYYQ